MGSLYLFSQKLHSISIYYHPHFIFSPEVQRKFGFLGKKSQNPPLWVESLKNHLKCSFKFITKFDHIYRVTFCSCKNNFWKYQCWRIGTVFLRIWSKVVFILGFQISARFPPSILEFDIFSFNPTPHGPFWAFLLPPAKLL